MANKLNRLNQCMNDLALRELQLQKTDHVLEIGFGGGDLLKQILDFSPTLQVTGLDFSTVMISVANKRFSEAIRGRRLSLALGDADHGIPFASSAFDKVCTVNTIYFWKNVSGVLKECHRILKMGGDLIICFNPKEELEKWGGHRHGFHLYTLENVLALVGDAGFQERSSSV
jgi:ubiquinone/menaquinone biosynthesis C-methylase UbiE